MPIVIIRKMRDPIDCDVAITIDWEAHVDVPAMLGNVRAISDRLQKLGMHPVIEAGAIIVVADATWSPPGRRA